MGKVKSRIKKVKDLTPGDPRLRSRCSGAWRWWGCSLMWVGLVYFAYKVDSISLRCRSYFFLSRYVFFLLHLRLSHSLRACVCRYSKSLSQFLCGMHMSPFLSLILYVSHKHAYCTVLHIPTYIRVSLPTHLFTYLHNYVSILINHLSVNVCI